MEILTVCTIISYKQSTRTVKGECESTTEVRAVHILGDIQQYVSCKISNSLCFMHVFPILYLVEDV